MSGHFQHFGKQDASISLKKEDFLMTRDYPAHLFKYRNWSDKGSQWIRNREIFLTNPKDFYDQKDCRNFSSIRELTELELGSYLDYQIKCECFCPIERARRVGLLYEKIRLTPKSYWSRMEKQIFEYFSARIGVCCLGKSESNQYLWDAYANKDTGYCISYWSDVLFYFVNGGGPVQYQIELPKVKPSPIHNYDEQKRILIYHKDQGYINEDEYRTFIFRESALADKERVEQLPPEAFHSVIIGRDCDPSEVEEIRHSVQNSIGRIEKERFNKDGRLQLFINSRDNS